MRNIAILFITLFTVATSCKNNEKETKEETRMERVVAAHDELMPKMGTIGKLINTLEQKADSTAHGQKYKMAQDDLKDAYNYMMDWMKGFGDRFDADEIMEGKTLTKEKETWLIEEEEKVNIMRNKINTSIANAEALLKEESDD